MKISLNWLEEILGGKVPASPEEISEKLFSLGFEVSSVISYPKVSGVAAAKILGIEKHPNADKLRLAVVSDGRVTETVVCGAPNIEVGQRVLWARVGAVLAKGMEIKKAVIRGVESPGMLCSLKELGVGDSSEGILVLDEKIPLGSAVQDLIPLEDTVMDVEITPNRPDALSVTGIAREIAVAFNLNWISPHYKFESRQSLPFYPVEIEDPGGCYRYIAKKFTNVSIRSSSPKIQTRLIRSGIRPINNIVDITNYILLETGQPLHAFDADKIEGEKIVVRRAREKEKIPTLDGKIYPLDTDILVIADALRPVAIAGIMGGLETAVTSETKNILLESAIFSRGLVRYGRNKLNLSSESSYRFERGVSRWSVQAGSDASQGLIEEISGGRLLAYCDVQSNSNEKVPSLTVRNSYIQGVLGESVSVMETAKIFQKLGVTIQSSNDESLTVQSPEWRIDLELEADYAEEIARVRGYQNIPSQGRRAQLQEYAGGAGKFYQLNRVRSAFSALGFDEALNYGLVSRESAESVCFKDSWVEIENPLARDHSVLRPVLAIELLENLKSNLSYQKKDVRFFEIGTVFRKEGDKIIECLSAAAVAAGKAEDSTWQMKKPSDIDFYWIKGAAEEVLKKSGISASFSKGDAKLLHPGYSMTVLGEDKEVLGAFGLIHPAKAKQWDLPLETVIFEINLFIGALSFFRVGEISLLPEIGRDCSLWIKKEIPWEAVRAEIESVLGSVLKTCKIFDVYVDPFKPDHKSLSFTLIFQYPKKTLSDDEANALRDQVISSLANKFGAELRK